MSRAYAKTRHGEGRSALLSPDGVYRYWLRRDWGSGPRLVVVGLNPSTADGEQDDATICLLRSIAKREGFGGLVMLNLYAFRATDPADLWAAGRSGADVEGPRNAEILARYRDSGTVLAAWGSPAPADRQREVYAMFGRMRCLGINRDGSPWHPLRKTITGLWPWSPSRLPL